MTKMSKYVWPQLFTNIFLAYLQLCQVIGDAVTTSSWRAIAIGPVDTSEMSVQTRSKVECMRECKKYSHCSRVAFQESTATCFLHPTLEAEASGDGVIFYEDKSSVCRPENAIIPNAFITWRHTLTSLDSDITCEEGYMESIGGVTAFCSAEAWTIEGQCFLPESTNLDIDFNYAIPQPVAVGWKVCMIGTPFNATRFTVNLSEQWGRTLSGRFFLDREPPCTNFFSKLNGTSSGGQDVISPPLPMTPFVPFRLDFVASSEFVIDVYIDGNLYHSHTIPVRVTSIDQVDFFPNFILHDMDLWCA